MAKLPPRDKSTTLVEQLQSGHRCWHCGQRVESQVTREAMCLDTGRGSPAKWHKGLGPVWVTLDALLEHGLLPKFQQHIEDYPAEWRKMYLATATDPKYVPPDWQEAIRRGDAGFTRIGSLLADALKHATRNTR